MEASIRNKSILLTLLIHAILVALMFVFVLSTPNPPFADAGGGGGMLVSIGTVDVASGQIQATSEITTTQPQQTEPQQQPANSTDEEIITTENENTVAVKSVETPIKKKVEAPVAKTKTIKETTATPVKVPERQLNQSALFKGSNKKGSDGSAASGSGDQGDPQGDPASKFYGKNGNGKGDGGGDGGGSGGGSGDGKGDGKGSGVKLNLAGRKWLRPPRINDQSQETGKVVVAIIVDKQGKVISAIPGDVGSTTNSAYLYKLAKEAALTTPFNASPDGKETQKGTITFNFVLE
jgi:protein TonB